jgi:dynein light intermediate chain 1
VASPLQSLIHSSLGIHSLLKRQPLKHNVIDRDKVVVPPNWDSWGKIRVLRDGFDVEAVNKGWSLDIEESYNQVSRGSGTSGDISTPTEEPKVLGSAVEAFQEIIRDPSLDALQATAAETNGLKLEISSLDTQSFLATQVEVLDKIRQGNESSGMDSSRLVRGQHTSSGFEGGDDSPQDEGRVNEHIGPVQFNMGGIQVDADDMLQRLKVGTLVHPSTSQD